MNPEEINDEERMVINNDEDREFFAMLPSHSEIERMLESMRSDPEDENSINELQELEQDSAQDSSSEPLGIQEEIVELSVAEEVGHLCDLCHIDLATDPQRPNASLHTLEEACVLACGHVFHYKCLQVFTLDVDKGSTDPSCILCIT